MPEALKYSRYSAAVISLLACLSGQAFALSVTKTEGQTCYEYPSCKCADVTFSDSFTIREILFCRRDGGLKMPLAFSEKGRGYADVRVLSGKTAEEIFNAVTSGRTAKKSGAVSWRVLNVRRYSAKGPHAATVTLSADKALAVDFQVWRRDGKTSVSAPAVFSWTAPDTATENMIKAAAK